MATSALERYRFRKARVRQKVFGTAERPRLSVYRSLKHVYAQVIDDTTGRTLVSASSLEADLRPSLKSTGNRDAAAKVGQLLAERAKKNKITRVVFDRGGRIYHGCVRAVADGAREKGLEF